MVQGQDTCHGRMLSTADVSPLPTTQQDFHLLSEEAGGQGVQDGVQGAIDGEDEDDYPAGDGISTSNSERTLTRNMGIQQRASENTMKKNLLATATSLCRLLLKGTAAIMNPSSQIEARTTLQRDHKHAVRISNRVDFKAHD
ncbi:hypothetical protein EYF80_035066 [Liparis tanakae]|uniref:Uncharacterized protein n=1 Tax=Liparis tanakae TaxID=230148 RepID=A0A4Z2GPN5_9TELE|nr:hypothetical protein EYF80_035066 [Liparis tanakae]